MDTRLVRAWRKSTTQVSHVIEECYGQEPDWDVMRLAGEILRDGSIQPHDFMPPTGQSGFYFDGIGPYEGAARNPPGAGSWRPEMDHQW